VNFPQYCFSFILHILTLSFSVRSKYSMIYKTYSLKYALFRAICLISSVREYANIIHENFLIPQRQGVGHWPVH
jgi:hypothetical protein